MDPIFPLAIIAAIAGAATLGWRSVRRSVRPHDLRTSWRIVGYWCCQHYGDCRIEQGRCAESKQPLPLKSSLMPLTKYQYEGRGTGLWMDKDGPLIGSLCEGQWKSSDDESNFPHGTWHAPLFDFDFEAELSPDGRTLRVKKTLVQEDYLHLLGTMEAFGLTRSGFAASTRSSLERDEPAGGIEGYRVPASRVMSESVFPLVAPAKLIPSSTAGHFHLYLETRMEWETYVRLMRAMAHVGLLEWGWVELSERRKMAMLRKPENKKGLDMSLDATYLPGT